jgi:hypothetical protein
MVESFPKSWHQPQQLFQRHCNLNSSQIRNVRLRFAVRGTHGVREDPLAVCHTLRFLSPNLRVLPIIRFLDPVLYLLEDMILFCPLLRASAATGHNQLYGRRYQTHRRVLTRRRFPLVGRLTGRWVRALCRKVTGLTATVAYGVLPRPSSVPPPVALWA